MVTLNVLRWRYTYDLMTQTNWQSASGAIERDWTVTDHTLPCNLAELKETPEKWAERYKLEDLLMLQTPDQRSVRERVTNVGTSDWALAGVFDIIEVTPAVDHFGNLLYFDVLCRTAEKP